MTKEGTDPAAPASPAVTQVPCLADNLVWILAGGESVGGRRPVVVVDPAEPDPVLAALAQMGADVEAIWLTHHHADHVGGVAGLVAAFPAARVVGHRLDAARLPPLDQAVADGDGVAAAGLWARVIATPGHTRGAVCYHLPAARLVMTGDTLFPGGCGRLFEGTAAELWGSLRRLAALPEATQICAGHRYQTKNARFACALFPDDAALAAHLAACVAAAAGPGLPPPPRLADERHHNLFLRAAESQVQERTGTQGPVATLQRLRALRDVF